MTIGDILKVSNEGQSQDFYIISIHESDTFPYKIYQLMKQEGVHRLYVKNGVTIPQETLCIKNHIIVFESEIRGGDYYFMISVPHVLPL